jgi:hypothetical protein
MLITPPSQPTLRRCETPPKFELAEVELETLWEDARICEEELKRDNQFLEEEDSCSDDEPYNVKRRNPILVRLPCGDVHVCGGSVECKFLEATNGKMVCKYSGIEYGEDDSNDEFFDLNGGIGKKSGDPDQSCGEPTYGKYTKRPDPLAASKAAYAASMLMDESELPIYIKSEAQKRCDSRNTKRGALCVGESAPNSNKRGRSSKKNINDRDTCINLVLEAESVLGKLINYEKASSYKRRKPENVRISRTCPPPDPRMCDEAFVFNASLRKYVKNCINMGVAPNIDTLSNLAIMAQEVSMKARSAAVVSTGDELRTAKFRSAYSGIVVALWAACCKTPYMKNAKRGADAYRPFACGIIYASKRGVFLDDGTVVIPKCPELAAALPELRGTGGNSLAKTLHSSSHRGLCTLSRCIASVKDTERKRAFADVTRMARQFMSLSFRKCDI